MKYGNRKRLGLITEEQETAELVKEMNTNGGSGYVDPAVSPEYYTDPIRYAQDPIVNSGGVEYLQPVNNNGGSSAPTNSGTVTVDQPAPIDNSGDVVPVPRPAAKTINWPLLIGVVAVFFLMTKKSN